MDGSLGGSACGTQGPRCGTFSSGLCGEATSELARRCKQWAGGVCGLTGLAHRRCWTHQCARFLLANADERGTREYNLALGDRRATAVRDYLLAKGLNSARIRTVSYGKERPAVSGSNEDAWEKNRRAATVLN